MGFVEIAELVLGANRDYTYPVVISESRSATTYGTHTPGTKT